MKNIDNEALIKNCATGDSFRALYGKPFYTWANISDEHKQTLINNYNDHLSKLESGYIDKIYGGYVTPEEQRQTKIILIKDMLIDLK